VFIWDKLTRGKSHNREEHLEGRPANVATLVDRLDMNDSKQWLSHQIGYAAMCAQCAELSISTRWVFVWIRTVF
jgi:hypothetical protein